MNKKKVIFYFRQDLRVRDNPGLTHSLSHGNTIPIYIFDNKSPGNYAMGPASKQWLHHSLQSLNKTLNNKLNFYSGTGHTTLLKIAKKLNVDAVFWNRCYEPWYIKADKLLEKELQKADIEYKIFNGSLLWEPEETLKKDGTPYKVYSYFYRNGCLRAPSPRKPLNKPRSINCIKIQSKTLNSLKLLSKSKEIQTAFSNWSVGENEAQKTLRSFLKNRLPGYKKNRDFPGKNATSLLSPHLHFGEISPNQVWYATKSKSSSKDTQHFLKELAWREFSYSLLFHFPTISHKNFQEKFDSFTWKKKSKLAIDAWKKGKTGYPLVDAGMRELEQTGYMHNRVRMVVASFLVKNLLMHWHHGRDWFWERLFDADLANNSANWQWVAGSGADAAPYFRIFNPTTQGEKFDKDGNYTKKFVPELKNIPNRYLFKPWKAPQKILDEAKITLGKTYPHPIVDLATSRQQALKLYRRL